MPTPVKAKQGLVVFRHWSEGQGLNETARQFSSLDELFALCLQKDDRLLVDRVIIDGVDDEAALRTVTLVFQSVTLADLDDQSEDQQAT
jgi:hypothetical protein